MNPEAKVGSGWSRGEDGVGVCHRKSVWNSTTPEKLCRFRRTATSNFPCWLSYFLGYDANSHRASGLVAPMDWRKDQRSGDWNPFGNIWIYWGLYHWDRENVARRRRPLTMESSNGLCARLISTWVDQYANECFPSDKKIILTNSNPRNHRLCVHLIACVHKKPPDAFAHLVLLIK